MTKQICEISASSWFYYKEICYDEWSHEVKFRLLCKILYQTSEQAMSYSSHGLPQKLYYILQDTLLPHDSVSYILDVLVLSEHYGSS